MTIAERTLKEYLSKYEEKKAELRKIEDEISILSRCRDWMKEEKTETPKPESGLDQKDAPPEKPTRIGWVSKTDFDMRHIPERQAGFIHLVVRGGKYTLGTLIKGILIDAGISGNQLAEDMEISKDDLKDMILDRKVPYSVSRGKLAYALQAYTDIGNALNRVSIACKRTKMLRSKEAANA